jgi:hypothetical protein
MRFHVSINLDNAAFVDNPDGNGSELAALLTRLAKYVNGREWHAGDKLYPRDSNGNGCGRAWFENDTEAEK